MLILKYRSFARLVSAAAFALSIVAGCGGVDSGGTGAAAFAVGPISGFGSIIVNGTRFDDTVALIQDDDGARRTRDQLKLGVMTTVDATGLTVSGGSQRATATTIRISSEIVGPVDAFDAVTGSVTVLGQTVLVRAATVVDDRISGGLQGLKPGVTVEVYGRYDPSRDRYTATRIEPSSTPAFYKLRGAVTQVDTNAQTLVIGGQTINYRSVPAGDRLNIVPGAIVRAKLDTRSVAGVRTAIGLSAAVVQLPDRDDAQVEGRISAWTSSRQFSVNGVPVDASMSSFPDGESGVALGARVEVEGSSTAGVLRARVVKVSGDEDANNSSFELHGSIELLDTTAKTFVLHGVLVDYAGAVTFESGTAGDLAPGRRVQVQGDLSSDGIRVRAQDIKFEDG